MISRRTARTSSGRASQTRAGDEDVRPLLAEILRQRGYDAVHVLEVNRAGLGDREQSAYATEQQRAILTHNIRDFVVIDRAYRAEGIEHYGIVVSDQVPLRSLLRRTLRCLSHQSTTQMYNRVVWLQDFK